MTAAVIKCFFEQTRGSSEEAVKSCIHSRADVLHGAVDVWSHPHLITDMLQSLTLNVYKYNIMTLGLWSRTLQEKLDQQPVLESNDYIYLSIFATI